MPKQYGSMSHGMMADVPNLNERCIDPGLARQDLRKSVRGSMASGPAGGAGSKGKVATPGRSVATRRAKGSPGGEGAY